MQTEDKAVRGGKAQDQRDRRQFIVSILAAVGLLLLYVTIFSFSEQDGEESGSVSRAVSKQCVEIYSAVSGNNWSESVKQDMAAYFEHPIRKMAHFTEYTCMGILVYVMLYPWVKSKKKLCFVTVVWVLLSASADELHQTYVPGRYGCFADVVLDTCGGGFGVLLSTAAKRLWPLKKEY